MLLRHVRKLATLAVDVSDRDLLQRFAASRDEAAFAELVRRHGAMAYRTAERILHNAHDAEDVFQATFLTLSRKAGALAWRESIGPWLYEVANRLALEAKTAAARRRQCEGRAAARTAADPLTDITLREAQSIFDAELLRLDEHLRAPVILCHLEGATQDEAARQLGLSLGTFRRRLEQGRELLRKRLTRRGLALSAVLLASVLVPASGTAAIPAGLAQATVRTAVLVAVGGNAAGSVSDPVLALMQALGRNATLAPWKPAAAIFLVAAVTVGAAFSGRQPAGERKEPTPTTARAADQPGPKAQAEAPQAAHVDRLGDPLPAGALARMGTLRFRCFDDVGSIVFSPDGKLLAACDSESLRVWETATGKPVHFPSGMGKPKDRPHRAAFSPDGAFLLALGYPQEPVVRLFEVASGKQVASFKDPPPGVLSAVFSPDGKVVALGSAAGKWQIRERTTGNLIRECVESDKKVGVSVMAFREQGKVLAVHTGNDLVFREVASGKEVKRFNVGDRPLVIAPDGKVAASIPRRGPIKLFDLIEGKALPPLPAEFSGPKPAVFTADSKQLLVPSADGTVTRWNLAGRTVVGKVNMHVGTYEMNSVGALVGVSPDGRTLATVCDPYRVRRIRLWDLTTGKERFANENNDPVGPTALCFLPDGQTLATVDGSATVRLYNATTGEMRKQFSDPEVASKPGAFRNYKVIDFTPDGRTLLLGMTLWDVPTGKLLRRIDGWGARLSPDGTLVAVAGASSAPEIRLSRTATGEEVARLAYPPGRSLDLFSFSSDGKTVLAVIGPQRDDPERSMARYVWDAATGKLLDSYDKLPQMAPTAWAQNGRLIGGHNHREKVVLFDTQRGQERHLVPGCYAVFSPDERLYAVTIFHNFYGPFHVKIYETASGQERLRFTGLRGWPVVFAFSPDSRMLASGNTDTTAVVWDLTGRIKNGRLVESQLTEPQLRDAWNALQGDARQAHAAIWTLASAPAQSVPWLAKVLRPAAMDEAKITKWITELGNERFAVRTAADAELQKLGRIAEKALRRELAKAPLAETQRRIEKLLEKLDQIPLQAWRALEVLERVGTPQAQAVLETLAAGVADSDITQAARESLGRLRQHSKAR